MVAVAEVEQSRRHQKLAGKVAIITGASRGIGREIALAFGAAGAYVTIAAKSEVGTEDLPGSIYTVANEVIKAGGDSLAVKVDVRDEKQIKNMVDQTIAKWGRVDFMICNAGALWWHEVVETPMNKYDLINQINARASFACAHYCLPHMIKQGFGHIIVMSPPIDLNSVKGKVAYSISKFGMTLIAHGLGDEMRGKGIACNALWPATIIESQASINFDLGERRTWRKATIIADATLEICMTDPNQLTGEALIDEDYLRSIGYKDADFIKYRYDPNFEPARLNMVNTISRGDVRMIKKSKL